MNKGTIKTIVYILVGFIIISAVVSFFFWALPYLLVIGLAIWIGTKIYGAFKKKNNSNSGQYSSTTYYSVDNDDVYEEETFDTSSAIDVDYKDVN